VRGGTWREASTGGRAAERGFSLVATIVAAATASSIAGCSIALDWTGYTGGAAGGDAGLTGAGDGAGAGVPAGGACSGDVRCVPPPPDTGWIGPLALYDGPPGATLPDCAPGESGLDVFSGLTGPAASCSTCACAAPQGDACTDPALTFFADPGCAMACGPATSLTDKACVAPPTASTCSAAAFAVGPSTPAGGGACAASGGMATLPPATWSRVARACMPVGPLSRGGGSCPASSVCLPNPASPPQAAICVEQAGDAACPATGYPSKRLYYTGVDDQRGCTPCTCAAPAGASCSFAAASPGFRYDPLTCTAPMFPFGVPTACQTFTGGDPFKLFSAPVLDPGSCASAGGEPTGTASPTGLLTFCCSQ